MVINMDEYTLYLKLLSFVFGISTDVIHHYFEIRILNTLTFHTFLNNNKHILFHEYLPTVQCCQCLSVYAPSKRSCLRKDQFSSLFDWSGPAAPNHVKKTLDGSISQYCLCSLSPVSNVSIDVMDISLVCALVRKCPSIPGNPAWLEPIRDTRNYLVHLSSVQLSSQEFENRWIILESAVLNIAGVIGTTYQKTTRKHIAGLKMDTLSLTGVKDIIKDINDEAKQKLVEVLRMLNENKDEIMNALESQFEKLSIDIRNLTFEVQITRKSISPASSPASFVISILDGAGKEDDDFGDVKSGSSTTKCYVLWKFANPVSWDMEKVVKTLRSVSALLKEWLEIEFVYIGSLVIKTTILESIVVDEHTFVSAIKSFISTIVDLCDLDSPTRQIIDVLLDVQHFPHVTASLNYPSLNCFVCQYEVEDIADVYYCQECIGWMCESCFQVHQISRISQSHRIMNLPHITQVSKENTHRFTLFHHATFPGSDIKDIKSLASGKLAIADYNKKIIIYQLNEDSYDEIVLPFAPWYLAVINDNYIAVSFRTKHSIGIVDIAKGDIKLVISLEKHCTGITFFSGVLFVTAMNSLFTIDFEGNPLASVNIESLDSEFNNYICIGRNGKTFVNDYLHNQILQIDELGYTISIFKSKHFKYPSGLTIDDNGYVYVVCSESNNVFRINPENNEIQIILTADTYSSGDTKICFQDDTKLLAISNGNIVSLYSRLNLFD
ncbi:unnamed protein product [Mytilus edulis]|uniref:B box-type domain-containing protein n=1 Tax=Mytilus edulis TaxID=6550 RepID=A0A8S3R7Z9_MYTED|nr:unnamed protein product [Mytilus edulis]